MREDARQERLRQQAALTAAEARASNEAWFQWFNNQDAISQRFFLRAGNNQAARIAAMRKYVRYNPVRHRIEVQPIFTRPFRQAQAPASRRAEHRSHHSIATNPFNIRKQDRIHRISNIIDPLHGIIGEHGRIGSYIEIKELPSVMNVLIKKKVQRKAVGMLVERIKSLHATHDRHVILKRKRSGKYVYSTLFTSTDLTKTPSESIVDKIMNTLKKHKSLHLIVK